jgi:putative membrane protein
MNRQNTLAISLLVIMVIVSLPAFFGLPLPIIILMLAVYVATLVVFSFVHGAQTLGLRGVSALFCITMFVTYLMEWLGTHFGVPFGHYYYTDQLGPLLLDVPAVIPLQWFNMIYACYVMTDIILSRVNREGEESHDRAEESALAAMLPRMLVTSIMVGLFMVSWDFINDPYMVGLGSWVWTSPNEFFGLMLFGIPLSNFLGWVLTSAVSILLLELFRHRSRIVLPRPKADAQAPALLLVLVPYLYALVYQVTSGVLAGVFSLTSMDGWGPIVLAAVCMGFAAALTVTSQRRTHS